MFQNNFLNNNNNLPWPADSLNRNPINIRPDQPPFVPNVPCTPEFQQVIPLVTGYTIQAINQGANTSNLRAFAFNQLSENNFQNQDFVNLVALVVSLMMYSHYVQRNNYQLEQLIRMAVEKGIEYQLASNVAQYPALANYLDVNAQNYVRGVLNELQQMRGQLQAMMSQLSGGGGVFGMNTRPSFSSGGFGVGNNGGGSAVFSGTPMQQPIQQQQPDTSFGTKYGNIKPAEPGMLTPNLPEPAQAAPTNIKPDNKAEDISVPTPINKSPLVWKPRDEQPYPPIVKRSESEVFISLNEEGIPVLSIGDRTKESMFDYETHTTLTSFGVRPSTRPLPTVEEMDKANDEIVSVIKNGSEKISDETEFIPAFKILEHGHMFLEFSLATLCLEHELRKAGICKTKDMGSDSIKLFKTEGRLIENLGSLSDKDRLSIEHLRNSESFAEAVMILKASAATMPARAWRTIERKLTRVVNDVLRLHLSMDLRIDSFMLDIMDLMELLKNTSTAVYDSMVKNQVNVMRAALNITTDSDIETVINENILSDEIDGVAFNLDFEFLHDSVTLTSVDIDSVTLNVELYKNVGSVILRDQSKLLFELAHFILKNKPKNTNPIGFDYIMLSDGVLLRITRGLVGEDYITISVADSSVQ